MPTFPATTPSAQQIYQFGFPSNGHISFLIFQKEDLITQIGRMEIPVSAVMSITATDDTFDIDFSVGGKTVLSLNPTNLILPELTADTLFVAVDTYVSALLGDAF